MRNSGERWDGNHARKAGPGFSLIEVLVVVAIILTIAAVAIPSLMRSKMSANEAAAVANSRNINSAAVVYSSTWGNGYPPSLGAIGGPATNPPPPAMCDHALLLDPVLTNDGNGTTSRKSGYVYTYIPGPAISQAPPGCTNAGVNSYVLTAVPAVIGVSGQRGFFTDESGVIRYSMDGSSPTPSSPTLQ